MDLITARKSQGPNQDLSIRRDTSGIALFMVLSAISVLVILVSEFTYIAQIGQSIAYGGLDQAKAHYMAKGALKLSLLRLKAYQQVKKITSSMGGGAGAAGIPTSLIEKIWNFPFFYPIPTNIPGMSETDKTMINQFQKDSGFDGRFSAVIESESGKYNLNSLLPGFGPSPSPSPIPTATASPQAPLAPGTTPSAAPNLNPNSPQAEPSFSPDAARKNLLTYLTNILNKKIETDPEFAAQYRDFRIDELWDQIISWADRTYDRRTSNNRDRVQMKRAPFYSVTELHMLNTLDDDLYNLFAPSFTTSTTSGININTMQESTLMALVPQFTPDELKEFFKFRDTPEVDNHFKGADDFYKYLSAKVGAFRNAANIDYLKKDLTDRQIQLVTTENQFKITVQAQVNNSYRTIEAWVMLESGSTTTSNSNSNPNGQPASQVANAVPPLSGPGPGGGGVNTPASDSGLRITFMKMY